MDCDEDPMTLNASLHFLEKYYISISQTFLEVICVVFWGVTAIFQIH